MRLPRRALLALPLAGAAAPGAIAQTDAAWPARPVTLVVASAPGGALDAAARVLAPRLAALLGATLAPTVIAIDNRGGAGGALGVEAAARAPADGHTLLFGHLGVLVIHGLLRPGEAIDTLSAFAPVSLAVEVPSVLVVPEARPWRDLPALIAAARARPGALSWGHSGIGSTNHLSGALLDRAAGIETVGVPYRGGAPLALDLLAGRLDFSFVTSASVWPHIQAGRLRPLAVPAAARSRFLPEVPTVEEAAGLPGFAVRNWYGLLAPRATPAPVLAQLGAAMRAALAEPEVIAALDRQGLEATPSTAAEFTATILAEREKWAPILRAAGVGVD